ncbi:FAD-dependent oxidoreductase [Catenovulum sp. SM1970]|uniref:NAD(P)-binding protein n=1 Tax=Marinifaba aquimaris TaxID=2741323 RepID=UPI001574C4CD|nr:NAD(P)-binding protein [Marinifaba aquimaris]NTS78204.1 FAD-dependent oxidoreductase [Marinifaba aquimaris]
MLSQSSECSKPRIGIIGGGVGGATIALKLSEQGANVVLFEKETSLVNGPPMCHLHAGGNLYREISDQQCIDLLKQSISTARLYRDAIDYRPTVIAVPIDDNGRTEDVIARLNILQQEYRQLIADDPCNQVLGPAAEYFTQYDRQALEALKTQPTPKVPKTPDQWMIAFAKNTDLNQLKYPVCLVQEYGISVFRLAAIASLTLEKSDNCQVLTQTQVISVNQNKQNHKWTIEASVADKNQTFEVDYLINACGFRTGTIDDMVGLQPKRMVEFKAAYISHWARHENNWPEIIFHGTRGTKNGMTQLTPYPNGYFQIHAMTPDVTLFEDGLVSSALTSAQPQLPNKFMAKVNHQWEPAIINSRTTKAIDKVATFIPSFSDATVGGPPMYGAQQIPGVDASLRVADVAFEDKTYARCEIVKASSALPAANTIIEHLIEQGILVDTDTPDTGNVMTVDLAEEEVSARAESLALARNFPKEMAALTNSL